MKKTVALVLATIFCLLTFCACGNEKEEVAEKLDGEWVSSSVEIMGDAVYYVITFSKSDGGAGSFEKEFVSSSKGTISTTSGTYGVDMYNQDECTITLVKQAYFSDGEMETYDNKDKESSEETLTYTYEDGVLRLFDSAGKEYTKN